MRFISADRLFDGHVFHEQGRVLVLDESGRLLNIIDQQDVEKGSTQRLEGTLTPGFVNAHCHLELSHLKNAIPEHTGLPGFAKHVVTLRNKYGPGEVKEQMKAADRGMWESGIVAVGDIGNGEESFSVKAESPVFYHSFIELIGLRPENANDIFENGKQLFKKLNGMGLAGSLVPHAPYSTSTQLIKKIADFDAENNLPFSIHNQESEDEARFFMGEQSGFHDLYQFLGLDVSWFKAPGTSSLANYAESLSSARSLLVHNTLTRKDDVERVKDKNVYWCFCPGANQYIENKIPDFSVFKGLKKICLGTDSLAGNHHLDLIGEANVILKNTDVFTVEDLLRAMTSTAAEALGISASFGQLMKGKNTGLNLIKTDKNQLQLIRKIV